MVCNPVVVAAIIQKFKDFSLISGYLDSIIMRAVYKTSLYTVTSQMVSATEMYAYYSNKGFS